MRKNRGDLIRLALGAGVLSCFVFAMASHDWRAVMLPRPVSPHFVSPRLENKQDGGAFTLSDNVNLVVLDVSVKDPRGGYVTGLGKDAFQVYDGGQLRAITQFDSVDTPVTIGLVVDNSGSMAQKRPEVVLAGLAFAKESNRRDQFFVVNFNNFVIPGLARGTNFTDDLQTIRRALFYGRPVGQTALYDAIAYSLKHLEISSQEKRTLIVVSDGGDNVSKTSFPGLVKLVEASRATIYTVGLFDAEDHDRNPAVLRTLAKISGGEFFQPATLDEVMPVFHKIAKDIRNRYTIAYVPDQTDDKHSVRSVRVSAQNEDHRKLVVRTRTTYSTSILSQLLAEESRKDTQDGAK